MRRGERDSVFRSFSSVTSRLCTSRRFRNVPEHDNEQKEDEKKEKKPTGDSPNAIDFGISVLRWIPFAERPHFKSFRQEITKNPDSTITEEMFERFLIECSEKIRNSTITLKEMMALKLFTDCTKFQSYLRKAHWVNTPLWKRKMYYVWALALYEAALYHAVPIPSVNGQAPVALYHGLNKMFTIETETPKYHGPFSSTTARSVAHHFTNEQGLFFKMQPSHINPLKCCLGIKVESISCHQHEREILLVDQFLPITTAKTFQNSDAALVNYLMFSVKGWNSEIVDKHEFLKQLGIKFTLKWMPLIEGHSLLFHRTVFKDRLLIIRLMVELGIFSKNWVAWLFDERKGNKQAIVVLVEKYKVRHLLPYYRVMFSKFQVVQSHHLNLCLNIKFIPSDKMNHIADVATAKESYFEESEYKINGVPVAHTISTFSGIVKQIECRNTKLFGDKPIWIQKFSDSLFREPTSDEFIKFIEENQEKRLLPHYRVLTSKFRLVETVCLSIKQETEFTQIEFIPNTNLDHVEDAKSVDVSWQSCFKETEYEINGVFVPYTASVVKGSVREIYCRNRKLFGGGYEWVQSFPVSTARDLTDVETVQFIDENKVKQLLPHYRVLTSGFQVVQSHILDKCFEIEFLPNDKINHIENEDDLDNSCFEGSEYFVSQSGHFQEYMNTIPYNISSFDGIITSISCVNTNLFGDRRVWVQNFPLPTNKSELAAEVIDLVENHNVHQLLPHYRVLTSRFQVVQNDSDDDRYLKIEFTPNTKMDHIEINKSADDSCFRESEYKIDGIVIRKKEISIFKGIAHQIQCRNTKVFGLFGDGNIWTQQIEASHDLSLVDFQMHLLVHRHRGHLDEGHPKNLLDGNPNTHYWSNDDSSFSDWIVFKQRMIREKADFFPKRIMIRNGFFDVTIQSIAISWSENGKKYFDLMNIQNIKMDKGERRFFDLDEKCCRETFGRFKYIRMDILKSLSFRRIGFCEFAILGSPPLFK